MNGHDRSPVEEKPMSTIDAEKATTPEPGAPQMKNTCGR
jgi:hypothetical protein